MTISLNSVILDDDLYWEEEYNYPSVVQSIFHTVLGQVIVQSTPLTGGHDIVLSARNERDGYVGFFTREQIEGFKLLEKEATPVIFIFGSDSYMVIIKAGGIQVEPLFPYTTKSSSDKFIGSLILIKL